MSGRIRARGLLAAGTAFLCGTVPLLAGALEGRLFDSEGRPIAGARVLAVRFEEEDERLLAETEARDPEVVGEALSDASGAYRIAFDKPGVSVAVRVAPAGLPEARFSEPFDSGDTATLEDPHFPPASKLAGKVTDAKGAAVPGARVRAIRDDDAESGADFVSETRTGPDGSWSLPAAPEGARRIDVRADGFVPQSRFLMRRGFGETTVLRRGGRVRGTVVDPSGRPVAGAIVVGDEVAARTDAGGGFLLTGLAGGMRSLETQWKEELAARREVRVAEGGEASIALKLARAAAVTGSVTDEVTRRPVPGARITVREAAGFGFGSAGRRARADARGRFRAGGLTPGRYRVEAVGRGYLPSSLPGVVAAVPSGAPLAIALRKEAAVAGRVVDEGGRAVAGAHVAVQRDFGPRRIMRLGRAAFAGPETRTGPDGTFSLRRLNPSTGATVEASKAGYAAARKTGLALKSGETLRGVSLLLRVGLSARGRVVDAEGKGIAGAEVQATRAERGRRAFTFVGRGGGASERPDAITGADGAFELKGLEAARYQIAATKEGLVQKAPGTVDVSEKGENAVSRIVLEAGGGIAGAVRNRGGEPIAGARVFVSGEGGRPLEGTTDPAGRFRISGAANGRAVMLIVSAEGYAMRQSNATPPADDLAIVLDTAGVVRGRAEDADNQAPLLDFSISRSEPVSGGGGGIIMRVMSGREARAFHSEDGSFELPDVPPGRWTIRAEAAGYRAAELSGVEVGPGETKEGVVLSLKRGGTLTGRVVEATQGAPVANASVSWTAVGGGGGGMRFGPDTQQTTGTDADGRFSFDSLPEGKIRLEATHPDYVDGSVEADPQKQATVEIPLGSGGAITGTVVGSDGRTPAAGARVSLDTQGESGRFGGNESATADGNGAYSFEHLKAGRYELVAQGNAGSSPPRDVVLSDNQRADGIVLQTMTGTLLRGTVSGLPASALGGLRIFASSSGYSDGATTDADGHFTIPDVPSGVVRVAASTSLLQGRSAQTTVEIPEGAPEFPVEIAFEGSSRLSGQVTRGGRPISGLIVFGVPDPPVAGAGRSSAQTDGDGRYSLEGLTDGTYDVSINGAGVSYRKEFQVSGDTAGDIALPATTLSGFVRDDSTGQPIEGADIQAETGQETQSFGVKRGATDSSGAYSIDAMDPGAYQVTARKAGYRLQTQTATVGTDPASLDFSLKKGSGLPIRVADGQTGIPLSGVQVLAFAGDGTVAYQGRIALGSDGSGEVPSLADGRYAIYVFSDGYAARSLPTVDVPSPGISLAMTPGGRVEVRSGASLSCRLVDASGSPVLLSPFRFDGSVTAAAPVTVWEHLAPGSYRLVYAGGNGEQTATFDVAEGQTTQVNLN